MRIGLVSPYSLSVPGGVQGQVIGLARALRAAGHTAQVLGPCDGAPPEPGITPLGASIPTASNGSVAPIAPDPACALRTIRALWDEDFDLVHLHEPIVPGPCQTTLLLKPAPLVGTWHAAGRSKAYRVPGVRWLADRMDHRCAVSPAAVEMARTALGGSYEVTFNGVEVDLFTKADPWPTEAPTIFFLGRHEERKGLEVLLEAMTSLPHSVRLWIASDGPETARLRQLYAHDPRLEWLGRLSEDEKRSRLRGADVACFPSLHGESFGVVLLEAMAAGTPVVASDLAGYRNVATHGHDALLVDPGRPAELAGALWRTLSDPLVVESLVAGGEQRADELSMDRLAARYVDIYRSLIP